jgi:hypothetical protein
MVVVSVEGARRVADSTYRGSGSVRLKFDRVFRYTLTRLMFHRLSFSVQTSLAGCRSCRECPQHHVAVRMCLSSIDHHGCRSTRLFFLYVAPLLTVPHNHVGGVDLKNSVLYGRNLPSCRGDRRRRGSGDLSAPSRRAYGI